MTIYGKVGKALEAYTGLVDLVESKESTNASNFEMDFWEERWVHLQQQEQQLDVVLEYAKESKNEVVMLECAWRQRDWDSVRSLCISPSIITAIEAGDPAMKICETLSAVADGKLGDVENLHAQSSQESKNACHLRFHISCVLVFFLCDNYHYFISNICLGNFSRHTTNFTADGTLQMAKLAQIFCW